MGIMNKIRAALCCGTKENVVAPQKLQESGSLNGLVIANTDAEGFTAVDLLAKGSATPPTPKTGAVFTVVADVHPQPANKSPASSVNEFDSIKREERLLGFKAADRAPAARLLKSAASGTQSVVVNRYKEREQRNIKIEIPVAGRVIVASTASSLMNSVRTGDSGMSTPVVSTLGNSVDTAHLETLLSTLKARQSGDVVDSGLPPVPPLRIKKPTVAPRPAARATNLPVVGDLVASAPAAIPPAPPIPPGGIKPIKPARVQTITITVKEQGNNVKAYVHPSVGNAIFAGIDIAQLRGNLRKAGNGTDSK